MPARVRRPFASIQRVRPSGRSSSVRCRPSANVFFLPVSFDLSQLSPIDLRLLANLSPKTAIVVRFWSIPADRIVSFEAEVYNRRDFNNLKWKICEDLISFEQILA